MEHLWTTACEFSKVHFVRKDLRRILIFRSRLPVPYKVVLRKVANQHAKLPMSQRNIDHPIDKSSRTEMFCKKSILTEKHLCQSLFFNKTVRLRPATLLKKRLWHRCFPVNFKKLLGTASL